MWSFDAKRQKLVRKLKRKPKSKGGDEPVTKKQTKSTPAAAFRSTRRAPAGSTKSLLMLDCGDHGSQPAIFLCHLLLTKGEERMLVLVDSMGEAASFAYALKALKIPAFALHAKLKGKQFEEQARRYLNMAASVLVVPTSMKAHPSIKEAIRQTSRIVFANLVSDTGSTQQEEPWWTNELELYKLVSKQQKNNGSVVIAQTQQVCAWEKQRGSMSASDQGMFHQWALPRVAWTQADSCIRSAKEIGAVGAESKGSDAAGQGKNQWNRNRKLEGHELKWIQKLARQSDLDFDDDDGSAGNGRGEEAQNGDAARQQQLRNAEERLLVTLMQTKILLARSRNPFSAGVLPVLNDADSLNNVLSVKELRKRLTVLGMLAQVGLHISTDTCRSCCSILADPFLLIHSC
jgi:hypothetical protein